MNYISSIFFSFSLLFLNSCHSADKNSSPTTNSQIQHTELKKSDTNRKPGLSSNLDSSSLDQHLAGAATIFAKKQVPILCYHHIRALAPGKKTRDYEVTPEEFSAQMKALFDNGFKTITPDQLYNYLAYGGSLPSKPVIISFDDTNEEQFTIGKHEMDKYGFKGVFFVMTISINRPRYLTTAQIKELADEGNAVCCHTWDHHMVTKYTDADWISQIEKPRKRLESIIGKKINYFAYPFGLWNQSAIEKLKGYKFKLAFALSSKRSSTDPLFTVRRILVPGDWSVERLFKEMKSDFH